MTNNNIFDKIFKDITDSAYDIIADAHKEFKDDNKFEKIKWKLNFLKTVSDGEGLDFEELKEKYLTKKELEYLLPQPKVDTLNNEILDHIKLNNKDFYFEKKENGKVYNSKSKIVGKYKNDNIIFD